MISLTYSTMSKKMPDKILQTYDPQRDPVGPWCRPASHLGRALPVSDRLRAVEAIWESIVEAPESLPVPQSQRDELDRRLKLHQENPEAASPWEEVRSRLLGRE